MFGILSVAPDGSSSVLPDGGLTVGQRIGQLETAMVGINNRVDLIEKRNDRYDGRVDVIITIGKYILGSSLVATAIALVTLYLLVTGTNAK
jgi:hypothetical protein